ncbi:hypothetical protein [Kordia zhangzhouensis]|uniref:hypothetical protein n=1 Tax=Kordia zhangzhouensis TaxID=1620405 RepID=UPI0006298BFB|nr:hypothetical protein [Kordia zhangzhouensis]
MKKKSIKSLKLKKIAISKLGEAQAKGGRFQDTLKPPSDNQPLTLAGEGLCSYDVCYSDDCM